MREKLDSAALEQGTEMCLDHRPDSDRNPRSRMATLRLKLALFVMCSARHMDNHFSDVNQESLDAECKVWVTLQNPDVDRMELRVMELVALGFPDVDLKGH